MPTLSEFRQQLVARAMVNFDSDEDGSANQSEPEFGYKLPPPPPPHTSPIELWRALDSYSTSMQNMLLN
ncbi:hypothetical protein PC9H_008089 [Pleurotus ostreatus]|uniref:Uncharacterized protein n=1 Tax=Pleurotus ostreatus TaxID=5322 RepID=A0A8H6ZS97_PLEOS|nr:uncharacterized protein PC9H_008089 [Pleurotus ostreatus]KAF7428857.1 hypothetical protein PC9H_008089 [Pleurotus ostreatus]